MTVAAFPDEIIRRFLERLEQSPRFSIYLSALAYCARKELDSSALQHSWQANASGIESEDLPHIFDPFYRGHRVRESEMIGSGLGLTIVREVVKEHGGTVEVNSEPGMGSRFQICFPV